MFNLKTLFWAKEYGNMWREFKFEINYSKSGVARIYIGGRKTSYTAGGYGYDKESSVIAIMVNDLIDKQPYNKNVYGNDGKTLSGGTGFSSIKNSFETIGGKLSKIYSGNTANVYEIDFTGIKGA